MTDLKTTDPSRGPTWGRLVKRLNKRVIRTVSLISIPVLDAAVLVVGYYIENKYHLWINASSRFYEAAKLMSSGIFCSSTACSYGTMSRRSSTTHGRTSRCYRRWMAANGTIACYRRVGARAHRLGGDISCLATSPPVARPGRCAVPVGRRNHRWTTFWTPPNVSTTGYVPWNTPLSRRCLN